MEIVAVGVIVCLLWLAGLTLYMLRGQPAPVKTTADQSPVIHAFMQTRQGRELLRQRLELKIQKAQAPDILPVVPNQPIGEQS